MTRPDPTKQQLPPLYKQKSWSSDLNRDEAWLRRKKNQNDGLHRRSKSVVTAEDIEELRGCMELGFQFGTDEPEFDNPRLSDTFPALGLYYATSSKLPRTSSTTSSTSSAAMSDCGGSPPHPCNTTTTLFGPGDNPEMVKMRLKQWAQVVACTVHQSSMPNVTDDVGFAKQAQVADAEPNQPAV